ncbi:MAG: family 4 glycosyl hydrolase [Promethearchaeota archaeon]
MEKRIVLVGAGSTSFGPAMFTDIYHSKELEGWTIVLHDIDIDKLKIIHELLEAENELINNKFNLEYTTDRSQAFKDADFIISSIEIGERFKLWREDYEIPRKHGSTQILGECGGPGGTMHAFRIIPNIIDIVKDAEKICPDAFFINFSNPMARVCLAIKRATSHLKFVGLCHQIGFMYFHLPILFDKKLPEMKIKPYGLNHFGFLMGLEDIETGNDLMPEFNAKATDYFKEHEDRFDFSTLTFEVYKRFRWFPYVGDNHLGEYLQFGEEFTKTQDMIDWIDKTEDFGQGIYNRLMRYYNRFKKGRYPKKGMLRYLSGEGAIPIVKAIINDENMYETAVNIPNEGIIENLPQDLVIECPGIVNKEGVHGVKWGSLPKSIAAILRIEATIQDLCVDAILNKSKEQAITALAVDPNVGSFEMADKIFNEMREKHDYYNYFK